MTAKEYWKDQFDELPKNDADKLAVAMMAEYAEEAWDAAREDEDSDLPFPKQKYQSIEEWKGTVNDNRKESSSIRSNVSAFNSKRELCKVLQRPFEVHARAGKRSI